MQKYISLKGRFFSLLNRTKYKFKIKKKQQLVSILIYMCILKIIKAVKFNFKQSIATLKFLLMQEAVNVTVAQSCT